MGYLKPELSHDHRIIVCVCVCVRTYSQFSPQSKNIGSLNVCCFFLLFVYNEHTLDGACFFLEQRLDFLIMLFTLGVSLGLTVKEGLITGVSLSILKLTYEAPCASTPMVSKNRARLVKTWGKEPICLWSPFCWGNQQWVMLHF